MKMELYQYAPGINTIPITYNRDLSVFTLHNPVWILLVGRLTTKHGGLN